MKMFSTHTSVLVTNVRDFDAILYDSVYVGNETTVLFVSAVCITTYFVK